VSAQRQLLLASQHLRKLVASRGRLRGHFYLAADSAASQAVLVVTLAARDDSGQKCRALGRGLRRSLPGARFATGPVAMDGGTLRFTIQGGTAAVAVVRRSLRGPLSHTDQGGLDALGPLLKKAAVRRDDSDDDDDDDVEELTDAEQAALSEGALGEGELSWLAARQDALDSLRVHLQQRAPVARLTEATAQHAERGDDEALREARAALASACASGNDPFSAVLPPEIRLLAAAGSDATIEACGAELRALEARYRVLLRAVEDGAVGSPAELESILAVLRQAGERLLAAQHAHRTER